MHECTLRQGVLVLFRVCSLACLPRSSPPACRAIVPGTGLTAIGVLFTLTPEVMGTCERSRPHAGRSCFYPRERITLGTAKHDSVEKVRNTACSLAQTATGSKERIVKKSQGCAGSCERPLYLLYSLHLRSLESMMLFQQSIRQFWPPDLLARARRLESKLSGFLKTNLLRKGGLKSAGSNLSEILRRTCVVLREALAVRGYCLLL